MKCMRMAAVAVYCSLVCAFLLSCAAPTTRSIRVNQSLVDKERNYQFELTLQQQLKYQQQLDNVAWPLYRAALSICHADSQSRQIGMDAMSLQDFPKEYQEAARKLFSIGDELQIISVTEGSPAARAGFKSGDILKSMDGRPIASGKDASRKFLKGLRLSFESGDAVELEFERAGRVQKVAIKGEMLCYFPVYLSMDDTVNAYADGQHVVITKGMLRFNETSLETATVIAHELGHNIMNHMDAKKNNYWLGTLADVAAAVAGINTQGGFARMGATAYSQEFETEADYVSVYILALAKMDIDQVANFWRRMAAEHPSGIKENHDASHPSTPERFLAIENTVEEIRLKQKLEFPLAPDTK